MATSPHNPFGVSRFMHGLARFLFRISGWQIEGAVHRPERFVLISAPHTSYWDAIVLLVAAHIFRVKLSWYVKSEAFIFPLSLLIRYFGGIPIYRRHRRNMVAQAVEDFANKERLILAVPPEGTRGRTPYWKTGFYHIARNANVPLVLGYIDFKRKVAGLGPAFVPTGDIAADFEIFREFYAKVTPKYPELRGNVAVDPRVIGATEPQPLVEPPVAAGTAAEADRAGNRLPGLDHLGPEPSLVD
ncbi:MAG TPA: 1-acyl-sn-glycerol-3-phosphate acyltransferase [Terriglobales bacterium]|nr:1-acyl-sn-glycerol-3-phosphate acyltransferase [Terriglobales bacterium]